MHWVLAQTTGRTFEHEWFNQTTLHPIGAIALFVCGAAMLLASRRGAVLAMIAMACFVAPAQRIVVFTLDFNLLRVLVILGWLRLILRDEIRGFTWKGMDTAMALWAITGVAAFCALHGTLQAFVRVAGMAFDALGMYFLFRALVRHWTDLEAIVRGVTLLSVPVAAAFLLEYATQRNVFSVFGGVPATTAVRLGRMRCQGAFAHAILAGSFWASLMPVIAARWLGGVRERRWVVVGLAASMTIVIACASSTPVMGVLAGCVGLCMFPLRHSMAYIRWVVVLALVGLHIVMEAPVWHLISRVSAVGGSTGWHRYNLIDKAIRHFDEWWLIGTKSTAHWGYGLEDVTNQYVAQGVVGGLPTLALFVVVIGMAFRGVGQLWRNAECDRQRLGLAWALGVSLFVHCTVFVGVTYFGQIIVVWYLTLASIGSLAPGRQGTVRIGGHRVWRGRGRACALWSAN